MRGSKVLKINLEDSGNYLGREKGCLIVKNKKRAIVERYPFLENELGEIQIRSGNFLSSGALVTCAYWGINVTLCTSRGNPVAILKPLDNSSHVLTRVSQYKIMNTIQADEIAKQFVLGKLKGQDQVLKKYGLRVNDFADVIAIKNLNIQEERTFRRKLTNIEGRCSKRYFRQLFELIPEYLRPKGRKTFKAYDGINNNFNLLYEFLKWKVHIALINAKLEPYLGFVHSIQFGKPSLVLDFQDLYRYLVDDIVIEYSRKLDESDFVFKSEMSANKKGKRQYLNKEKTEELTKRFNAFFRSKVDIPRIKVGNKQEIETLINEETFLFAKYLRKEIKEWIPRIVSLA